MRLVDAVACPACVAEKGKRCRTLTTGRSTDTHEARRQAYWRMTPAGRVLSAQDGEEDDQP